MDHKELLKKYMNHVVQCEGVYFLDDRYRGYSDMNFTDEEWDELIRLADESVDQSWAGE